jgi:replication factor A1
LRHKPSIGEYLAFLSIKYEVNPEKFLHALRSAKEHNARCGNLSIRCRGKIKDKLTFLITRESEVIAQFPIDEEFLLNQNNQLKNFVKTDKIRKYLSKKNRTLSVQSIRAVRAGMTHVNLKAKILDVAEPKRVVTRFGNNASVAKVLIGDDTGTIKLCLWNGQIASVAVGDTIQIENAQASTFRGEKFLSLGKKGTLNSVEALDPQPKSMALPAAKA